MIVSAIKIQKYAKGIRYPASKQEIIKNARERGADENVIETLQRHRNKKYQSSIDLMMEYSETVRI
jgi:hypothetical protein